MSIAIVVAVFISQILGIHDADKFTTISYYSPIVRDGTTIDHHLKGWNDVYFIFFCINAITIGRFLLRVFLLEPFARYRKANKTTSLKLIDSGYFFIYYTFATVWGYYIFRDDEWWFHTTHLWMGYPHPMDFDTKIYYLVSLAFWIQCALSFFFEPPRKDDVAYFFHHILTISLIVSSYYFNFFRVGSAILIQQNVGDVVYYASKVLNYASYESAATACWIFFVFVWIFTRHIVFGVILWSLWVEVPVHLDRTWDPEQGYYYSSTLWYFFTGALAALQGLMLFWFTLILKGVYKFLRNEKAGDSTDMSDEEEETSTNVKEKKKEQKKEHKKEHKKPTSSKKQKTK
eukprot:TRINITY_DN1246_c0_g1_i1.p1 TRINITY_DN1246_c0_g1~~TRINITY_DN1246_c0_g1_i1.p1  ORF type:complete len:345 (+),score=62.86 TRINITY_DN1246_c0_g1_i1:203-1237(+)